VRADLVLQKEDVLKVDIGVHVRGRILDSAFTLTFEPTYNKLLEAVRAATNSGIQVFIRSYLAIVFISPYSDFCRKRGSMRDLGRLRGQYRKPWNLMKWRLEAKFILVCDPFHDDAYGACSHGASQGD
jgi:Metallopeptidase family M24